MGGALAYRLRADLRRRPWAVLGLVVLVGVLGGIVLATAAGARRTASAYERLLDVANPPDLLVSPPGGPGTDPTPFYEALEATSGIRDVRVFAGVPLVPEAGTPSERLAEPLAGIGVLAPIDGVGAATIGQPKVVAGRLPDPEAANEVLISEPFAELSELEVGDHIDAVLLTSTATETQQVATRDEGQPIRLIVTGVGVMYDEVVPFGDLNSSGSIAATGPLAALVARADWNFEGALIAAEPGTDLDELTAVIEELAQREEMGTGGFVFVSDQAAATAQVEDAMRPLAAGLAAAAVAIGLVALVVVGQAVSRASREAPGEVGALRSIGLRPRDRVALAAARAAVVGSAGALGAVVVALGLSGRFPIGVARVAEPDPGLRFDSPIVLGGAVAIVIATTLGSIPGAVLRLRQRPLQARPSRIASAAAATGLSPAAVQGVRFATVGGESRQTSMRSTLVAVVLATTSVLAASAFADSLVALVDSPSRYGQQWERMVDAQFGPAPVTRIVERFESFSGVRGIAAGNYGSVSVNGLAVPAFDLESITGDVSVGLAEGRSARADDEIVLGGETIERLGVRVGDTVSVDVGDGARPMEVIGRGVFPHMGQGSFSTTGLGVGAQLPGGTLTSFGDFDQVPPDYEHDGKRYNFVAIDVDGSLSAVDEALAEVEATTVADGAFAFVRSEQPPTKIRDLARVRVVPAVTAGVLALVAVSALAHALVMSVRGRRRELALLRALGFSRRQLHASITWQAFVIALAAAAVGAPLGAALGRAVWSTFADGLHASAPAETPWTWLAIAAPAMVALAILVAAVPGRSAGRTSPAVLLRDDAQ